MAKGPGLDRSNRRAYKDGGEQALNQALIELLNKDADPVWPLMCAYFPNRMPHAAAPILFLFCQLDQFAKGVAPGLNGVLQ